MFLICKLILLINSFKAKKKPCKTLKYIKSCVISSNTYFKVLHFYLFNFATWNYMNKKKFHINITMFFFNNKKTLVYPSLYFSFSSPIFSRIIFATVRSCFSLSFGLTTGTELKASFTPETFNTPYLSIKCRGC